MTEFVLQANEMNIGKGIQKAAKGLRERLGLSIPPDQQKPPEDEDPIAKLIKQIKAYEKERIDNKTNLSKRQKKDEREVPWYKHARFDSATFRITHMLRSELHDAGQIVRNEKDYDAMIQAIKEAGKRKIGQRASVDPTEDTFMIIVQIGALPDGKRPNPIKTTHDVQDIIHLEKAHDIPGRNLGGGHHFRIIENERMIARLLEDFPPFSGQDTAATRANDFLIDKNGDPVQPEVLSQRSGDGLHMAISRTDGSPLGYKRAVWVGDNAGSMALVFGPNNRIPWFTYVSERGVPHK